MWVTLSFELKFAQEERVMDGRGSPWSSSPLIELSESLESMLLLGLWPDAWLNWDTMPFLGLLLLLLAWCWIDRTLLVLADVCVDNIEIGRK